MLCLPLEFVYGWLFSINPEKVAPETKEKLEKYQWECYHVLYRYFSVRLIRQNEANKAEILQLKRREEGAELIRQGKMLVKEAESELTKIRLSRLDDEPTLF